MYISVVNIMMKDDSFFITFLSFSKEQKVSHTVLSNDGEKMFISSEAFCW